MEQYGLDKNQVHLVPISNDEDLANGCNAGHADHADHIDDNIASVFSDKVNGAPVIASDGTVSSQSWRSHSYKSKDDDTFRYYCDGYYTDSWDRSIGW